MPADATRIQSAFDSLPSDGMRQALRPMIESSEFRGVIPFAQAKRICEENKITMTQLMLDLVPFATAYAQPAISKFYVGAVAQGVTTQSLYFGANMEFVGGALSFTTHAEQAATTNAWMNGEQGLIQLAISAAPCGYCRQFLYEITTAAKLFVALTEGTSGPLTSFLPEAFGPGDLLIEAALMSPADHNLTLDASSQDAVALTALAAANTCYAPYTEGYAGVAVGTASGEIYGGGLAENAAFNPSMSPLEAALTMWNFASQRVDLVNRVVLVQVDGAVADQSTATGAVVESLMRSGPVAFEVLGAHVA